MAILNARVKSRQKWRCCKSSILGSRVVSSHRSSTTAYGPLLRFSGWMLLLFYLKLYSNSSLLERMIQTAAVYLECLCLYVFENGKLKPQMSLTANYACMRVHFFYHDSSFFIMIVLKAFLCDLCV